MLSGDRKGRPKQDLPAPLRTAWGATRVRLPRAAPVLAELGRRLRNPSFTRTKPLLPQKYRS